jgi:hypothetical protein
MNFPYYKQLDAMDCGPSCLRMVAKFYGKNYTLQALRNKAFISKSGVSMLGISDAAESIGFRTRGYRLTWEQLRDEVPLPCIVHWNQRHFVVVYEVKKKAWGWGLGAKGEEHREGGTGHRVQRTEQESKSREFCSLSSEPKDLHDSKYIIHVADPALGLLKYTESVYSGLIDPSFRVIDPSAGGNNPEGRSLLSMQ